LRDAPLVFEKFAGMAGRVEWLALGNYPTPVEKLTGICSAEKLDAFYIKRDDLSSSYYGGNKVRKLEFLLADAQARGHGIVLTFGAVGSNHVLATAIHAERLGMRAITVLMPQPNAAYVRKNLLLDLAHGVRFLQVGSPAGLPAGFLRGMAKGFDRASGKLPYVIPPGGSNARGTLGYVNAALELKKQVDEGLLPAPEFIFVACGSGGTAAGLILGARLAGLLSEIVPVRVVDKIACNRWLLARHVNVAAAFIKRHNPQMAIKGVHPRDILMIDDFCGPTYARFTSEGMDAISLAHERDGINLEGTYTGKTLAAALNFLHKHGLEQRSALFWNTYSSVDLHDDVKDIDYHSLPSGLHRYFEEPFHLPVPSCHYRPVGRDPVTLL